MAFQHTDPSREEFASRQDSQCSDSSMMDEILALLLQDHSSSDEEQMNDFSKDGVMKKKKDCGVPGQHCGSEQDESPEEKAPLPLAFSASSEGDRCHSISDIGS